VLLFVQGLKTGAEKLLFRFGKQLAEPHHRGLFTVLKDLIDNLVNPFVHFIMDHVLKFPFWILFKNASCKPHGVRLLPPCQFLAKSGCKRVNINLLDRHALLFVVLAHPPATGGFSHVYPVGGLMASAFEPFGVNQYFHSLQPTVMNLKSATVIGVQAGQKVLNQCGAYDLQMAAVVCCPIVSPPVKNGPTFRRKLDPPNRKELMIASHRMDQSRNIRKFRKFLL
jgi:hypothetical protein